MASAANKITAASSPFRYPGGKAWLANYLEAKLREIAPAGGSYAEPFAGGAGAAIKLLANGAATEIHLNDRDPRIYCAWRSILDDNERFLERLTSVTPSIEEWWACKSIVDEPWTAKDRFELGFATFFLNRTNRSGILQGAAPIGGYEQMGDWKLDARFYRETLLKRIEWLGSQKSRITVSRLDGIEFLHRMADRSGADQTLNFVDPPYVAAGSRLYLNAMRNADHRSLAELLSSGLVRHWIVTYDDCDFVRALYRGSEIDTLKVRYTLQRRRSETEVLITPRTLALPAPSND